MQRATMALLARSYGLIELLKTVMSLVVRTALLVASLIFLISVLAMSLILVSFWLLRAAWSKLTGQPVKPWRFRFNRPTMWSRSHRPAPGRSQVAAHQRDDSEVIDVEPKSIKPPLS